MPQQIQNIKQKPMRIDFNKPLVGPNGKPVEDPKSGTPRTLAEIVQDALFGGDRDVDERGKPKRDVKSVRLSRKYFKQLLTEKAIDLDKEDISDFREFIVKCPTLLDGHVWQITEILDEAKELADKPREAGQN